VYQAVHWAQVEPGNGTVAAVEALPWVQAAVLLYRPRLQPLTS
jgi:hypothetical protein